MASASENTIRLTIITPYKKFFDGDVSSVVITTIDGEMGFMPGHPPLIVALRPGMAHYIQDGTSRYFTISEGYCEVSSESIMVVCNAAEFPEDLSPRRTCKSYTEAYRQLQSARNVEDRAARTVLCKEYKMAMDRACARRHLLEMYGSDHQKERIAILVEEYDWKDAF